MDRESAEAYILANTKYQTMEGPGGTYFSWKDVVQLLESQRKEIEQPDPAKEIEYLEQVHKCLESLLENAAHSFRVSFYELNLALIETSRRLKELKPPEKHYVVIGAAVGEPIGCCPESGIEHVKKEEPKARFEEVDPERCPVCNAEADED